MQQHHLEAAAHLKIDLVLHLQELNLTVHTLPLQELHLLLVVHHSEDLLVVVRLAEVLVDQVVVDVVAVDADN